MEKDKALEMALGNIEKQFGKGSVMKMGDKSDMEIGTVPTGTAELRMIHSRVSWMCCMILI